MKKGIVLGSIAMIMLCAWQTSPLKQSIDRGATVYKQKCITCHQADGGGVPHLNPPLIRTDYVLGDKNRLISIVVNGLKQEIEIDDDLYSNPMPPVAATDQQIADVLTYIRNSFGNKASPITLAEVKAFKVKKKK